MTKKQRQKLELAGENITEVQEIVDALRKSEQDKANHINWSVADVTGAGAHLMLGVEGLDTAFKHLKAAYHDLQTVIELNGG